MERVDAHACVESKRTIVTPSTCQQATVALSFTLISRQDISAATPGESRERVELRGRARSAINTARKNFEARDCGIFCPCTPTVSCIVSEPQVLRALHSQHLKGADPEFILLSSVKDVDVVLIAVIASERSVPRVVSDMKDGRIPVAAVHGIVCQK